MITRQDVVAHLERSMRVGFLRGTRTYTPLRGAFVREAPSDGAFETYADMGAVPWPRLGGGVQGPGGTDGRTGAPIVNQMTPGGPIVVLGGNERAQIVYNLDWNIPIGVWHNAINDNRIGNLEAWAENAGSRFEQHKDYLAFNALNDGDSAAVYGNGYDGKPLFDANHADPGAEYSTVQSNINSLTLSPTNFNTVWVAGSKFLDDRGQPVGHDHTLLVYPSDLRKVVAQIIDNPNEAGTANQDINPFAGEIRGLRAPGGWLDSTFWALIDDRFPQKPLLMQEREAPTLVFWDDHTQGNGVRYYKWMARYAVAFGEWRLAIRGNT